MNDYLDPNQPIARRVDDLVARMSVAEKAGLMFHPTTEPGGESLTDADALRDAELNVVTRGISHFNVLGGGDSAGVAVWHNTLQDLAASTRLGIPITLSSDPRHGFRSNPFTGQSLESLSRWPETTGIAAIPGTDAAREYADIIRREFLAMGIRVYLGPMADIFSEPRWSRGFGTFGENPARVAELTVAFIEGLRGGKTLGHDSVAAVVKHFPGGGPQLRGDDAHDFRYPEQVYPGGMQELHIQPFEKAFAAGATQVMTYYGKPVGTDWDEVGFAFNTPVVQGILRKRLGFDGIVVTDWNLLESEQMGELSFGPNGWGLEHLTPLERARIAIDAGVDQFGGDRNTALIEELVDTGLVAEERIDQSARRLLREKFQLGIFENRHADVENARATCGAPIYFEKGVAAQRASLVLLSEDAGLLSGDSPRVRRGCAGRLRTHDDRQHRRCRRDHRPSRSTLRSRTRIRRRRVLPRRHPRSSRTTRSPGCAPMPTTRHSTCRCSSSGQPSSALCSRSEQPSSETSGPATPSSSTRSQDTRR